MIFVDVVHHCRFITCDSLQYIVIKKKSMAKVHSPANKSSSIKKEMDGASSNYPYTTVPQEGSTQEMSINLDDNPATTNLE